MFGILTKFLKMKKKIECFFFSREYTIIRNPENEFPIVFHIKDATWEEVYVAETYQLVKESRTIYYHRRLDVLKVANTVITDNSDLVIVDEKVLWDKALQTNFTKIIPLDRNLARYTSNTISAFLSKRAERIAGRCISLLGVHGNVWAHFIVQFLPKLYLAEQAGLLDEPLTLLVPNYRDNQLKQLVGEIVERHPCVKVLKALPKVDYCCEQLLYIPTTVYIANHSVYGQTCDCVIPDYVKKLLKEKLVFPLLEKVRNNPVKHEKLYLVRRGTYRCMKNWPAIEDFFVKRGFVLVEPHKLTLEEKADLFYHARYIVGPFSSAWSNTMFANGAKGLMMCNFTRCIESYQVTLGDIGRMKVLQLTGWDESSDIHTSFDISLQRLEEVYNQWINGKI